MKTALITGITGQDGAYLAQHLLEHNYKVIGGVRRTASGILWRLEELEIIDDIEFDDFELAEFTNIHRFFRKHQIDEVYNLAAQSYVAASFEMPTMTADITGLGVSRVLEAIRDVNPQIKFYQASSSEMFGKVRTQIQNENTPFYPRSPYGVAKLFGHWMTVNYRESYNMFCCSGILFNHESPLRGPEFVTRKISIGIADIYKQKHDYIELGNLNAKRDWGFAGDYVKAMYAMLQQDKPGDYVISTGESHSVREFVERSFHHIGKRLSWQGEGVDEVGIDDEGIVRVKINKKYYRNAEVDTLCGDSTKAREFFGWKPQVTFEGLVDMMIEAELKR